MLRLGVELAQSLVSSMHSGWIVCQMDAIGLFPSVCFKEPCAVRCSASVQVGISHQTQGGKFGANPTLSRNCDERNRTGRLTLCLPGSWARQICQFFSLSASPLSQDARR